MGPKKILLTSQAFYLQRRVFLSTSFGLFLGGIKEKMVVLHPFLQMHPSSFPSSHGTMMIQADGPTALASSCWAVPQESYEDCTSTPESESGTSHYSVCADGGEGFVASILREDDNDDDGDDDDDRRPHIERELGYESPTRLVHEEQIFWVPTKNVPLPQCTTSHLNENGCSSSDRRLLTEQELRVAMMLLQQELFRKPTGVGPYRCDRGILCEWGIKCLFFHTASELQYFITHRGKGCRTYKETMCPEGHSCPFQKRPWGCLYAHSTAELRAPTDPIVADGPSAVDPSKSRETCHVQEKHHHRMLDRDSDLWLQLMPPENPPAHEEALPKESTTGGSTPHSSSLPSSTASTATHEVFRTGRNFPRPLKRGWPFSSEVLQTRRLLNEHDLRTVMALLRLQWVRKLMRVGPQRCVHGILCRWGLKCLYYHTLAELHYFVNHRGIGCRAYRETMCPDGDHCYFRQRPWGCLYAHSSQELRQPTDGPLHAAEPWAGHPPLY